MASYNYKEHSFVSSFIIFMLFLQFQVGKSELQQNYYSKSCPKAEEIIKQQVIALYNEHGNTAVSWLRNLFHDCIVEGCDASLLLEAAAGMESEKASDRSFGMRNFKYVNTIKAALEKECAVTVSCADVIVLSARDGIVMLGGPRIEMKTGRKGSKVSHTKVVDDTFPNHTDSISSVLSRFQSIGIDVEGTVALLGKSELQQNYYSKSCPKAEEIIKQQVIALYNEHGNTAVSWLRNLFHDCIVEGCDASLLLEAAAGMESEKASDRSFGMRNFKYVNTIKAALEKECAVTVSCADVIALSARDGIVMLGGPRIEMKTGRKDSKVSHTKAVDDSIPNHTDSISSVLSRFQSIGIDVEGTVALLGAHSVGRVHCVNLVHRLYPTVDPTLDPDFATYLKMRCPSPSPDPEAVTYSRFDLKTPMILDNMYYKNVLNNKGLLMIDQELKSDAATLPIVEKMAADNGYFHEQISRALVLMSENNVLTGDQGEVRKDCRFVNADKNPTTAVTTKP